MKKLIDQRFYKTSYLKEVIESTDYPEEFKKASEVDKAIAALLIQINLQLTRVFDMLRIATGYTEYPEDNGNISNNDSEDESNKSREKLIEEKIKTGIICGSCGKGVKPTSMGYCPKCNNDLKKQIAMELF